MSSPEDVAEAETKLRLEILDRLTPHMRALSWTVPSGSDYGIVVLSPAGDLIVVSTDRYKLAAALLPYATKLLTEPDADPKSDQRG